jgi:hypothetical protein
MKIQFKILSALLLVATFMTYAQSGGGFNINKSTLDAGGGQSAGGDFSVTGTIGQVDASAVISGENFQLTGGFWSEKSVNGNDLIFKNSFEEIL